MTLNSRLAGRWIISIPAFDMRRTKSAAVYAATNNLAACRELLGHKNIGSTAHYLGVDKRQALDLAKKIKV